MMLADGLAGKQNGKGGSYVEGRTESYAGVNGWKKGEKVKSEAYCDSDDVQRIEAVVECYGVAK